MKISKTLAALLVFAAALTTQAATINFTYTADNGNGSINGGAAFGPATVVIKLTGDTTTSVACTTRGSASNCIPATSGTVAVGGGAATPITALTNLNICATNDGAWVGVCNLVDNNTYSLGDVNASSGGVVNLNVTSGPFAYAANSIHTHPNGGGGTALFSVAAGAFVMSAPETTNTAASNVSWTVSSVTTSVPTLSEWALIILASLMAMFGIAATRRRKD